MKRLLDFVGGFVGTAVTLLLTPFIGFAIVCGDGFPVFVKLDRISEGRIIKVYKFRTMVRNAHAMKHTLAHLNERKDGPLFKMKDDPRLTPVGKFLRKFRLDEFPQFLNVLKGELSLVGPRPHEPEEMFKYPSEYKKLYYAKGGLTGLSQVMGASLLPFKKELEYDLYYLEHKSFWLDIEILFKTFWIFIADPTGV